MSALLRFSLTAVLSLLTACAASPASQRRQLAMEEANLEAQAQATSQAVEGAATYSEGLESGRLAPSLLLSAAALEEVWSQTVPQELPAKQFHAQLAGTIRIERVSGFQLLPGNTVRCRLHLRGKGLRFTGKVPSMFKKEVSDFVRAFEGGGAEIELELLLSAQKGKLEAKAEALSARLPTAKSSSGAGLLRDEMNHRALRQPLVISASTPGGSALQGVLVTPHHVVLSYKGP